MIPKWRGTSGILNQVHLIKVETELAREGVGEEDGGVHVVLIVIGLAVQGFEGHLRAFKEKRGIVGGVRRGRVRGMRSKRNERRKKDTRARTQVLLGKEGIWRKYFYNKKSIKRLKWEKKE